MNFKDTESREYECKVTLATVIALKKIGVNLNNIADGDLLTRLADDPELLVSALYLICEGSITKHGLTSEQFAAGLGGDAMADAIAAMWDAIASFSPPPQRAALRKIWQKTQEINRLDMEKVSVVIDNLTPESFSTLNASAGSAPGSQG